MPGLITFAFALFHVVSLRTASANSQPAQVSRYTAANLAGAHQAQVAIKYEARQQAQGVA